MAERGLHTKPGRQYSEEMMKRLLSRRFYIGRIVWKGKEYEGVHPPLLSSGLFYRVQDVLKSRHADTGEKGRLHFLMRGTAVCATCGKKLTAEQHPRGAYYRCPTAKECGEAYTP